MHVSQAKENMYEVTNFQGGMHHIARSRLIYWKRDRIRQDMSQMIMSTIGMSCTTSLPTDISFACTNTLTVSQLPSKIQVQPTTSQHLLMTPIKTAFIYSFDTRIPGHGKGPFDRIGGRWKRRQTNVRQQLRQKKWSSPRHGTFILSKI